MSDIENFPDWKSLLGTTLEGGYELKEIMEAERDRAMVRIRVLGDYTLKATGVFYALNRPLAEKQVGLWQTVRHVEHRSDLNVPLGAGILSLNLATVAYLVLQNADESLGEVVQTRVLSNEEAMEVLRSNVRALEELHANGLVHGCVSPEEVLAVGDSIQLSTESVREVNTDPIVEPRSAKYLAPESATRNLTIASDTWCLGATLFETLTKKVYEPGLHDEAIALKHPFGTLEERCLDSDPDKRCKLAEIEGILRSKAPAPKPKPVVIFPVEAAKATAVGLAGSEAAVAPKVVTPAAPVERTAPEVHAPAAKVGAENGAIGGRRVVGTSTISDTRPLHPRGPVSAAATSPAVLPRVQPDKPGTSEERQTGLLSGSRGWILAIAAFVVIFLALWVVRSRSAAKTATVGPDTQGTSTAAAPSVQGRPGAAWPTKTLNPDAKTPTPAHTENQAPQTSTQQVASASPGQGKPIWRVVLYTYNHQQDAYSRAQEIANKRPDLQVQVFSPAKGGPYLVVAGGGMNHEDATRMRLRAMREGMPHDTYVQNYSK